MNAAVKEGSEGPEIPANGAGLTGPANQAKDNRWRVGRIGTYGWGQGWGPHLRAIARCDKMQTQQSSTCQQHINTESRKRERVTQPEGWLPFTSHSLAPRWLQTCNKFIATDKQQVLEGCPALHLLSLSTGPISRLLLFGFRTKKSLINSIFIHQLLKCNNSRTLREKAAAALWFCWLYYYSCSSAIDGKICL